MGGKGKLVRDWKRSSIKTGNRTNFRVWLFLWLVMSSLSVLGGCAKRQYVAVSGDPCPTMSQKAIADWGQVYHKSKQDLRAWMGQMIDYCEIKELEMED